MEYAIQRAIRERIQSLRPGLHVHWPGMQPAPPDVPSPCVRLQYAIVGNVMPPDTGGTGELMADICVPESTGAARHLDDFHFGDLVMLLEAIAGEPIPFYYNGSVAGHASIEPDGWTKELNGRATVVHRFRIERKA